MKVHIIVKTPYPLGRATTARVYTYARGFIENNVDCEIIIPIPLLVGSESGDIKRKGLYKGTSYRYASFATRRSRYFLKRRVILMADNTYNTIIYIFIKTKRHDIILLYEGSRFWFEIVTFFAHICSLKVVMELNELPFVFTEQTERVVKKRELFFLKFLPKLDGVITISESLFNTVKKYFHKDIIKVPIIVLPDRNHTEFHANEKFIFHSGTLSENKDGICGMIEAFGLAQERMCNGVKFLLTGTLADCDCRDKVEYLIEKYNLQETVCFLGYLDRDKLLEYQQRCSVVIINKHLTLQNQYCFATKIGEYLALSKPIIITNVGEATYYLKDGHNSYVVEAGNPNLIADKIIEVFKDSLKAKRIGCEGHKLVEKEFNYMYQTKRLIDYFQKI